MNYTITGASYVKNLDFKGKQLNVYRLSLAGESGPVEMVQTADRPEPKEGDTLEGTIERNSYGARFKRSGFSGGGKNVAPSSPRSDYSMFAAYAKDILVAYGNFMDWDASKMDEISFNKFVRMAAGGARLLRDGEHGEQLSIEEVKSSW